MLRLDRFAAQQAQNTFKLLRPSEETSASEQEAEASRRRRSLRAWRQQKRISTADFQRLAVVVESSDGPDEITATALFAPSGAEVEAGAEGGA